MIKQNKHRDTEKGLTLIEIAIAMLVIGFLTVAFLQLYEIQQRERLEQQQNYKVFTISDGISRYKSEKGHYPCPGRRDKATTDDEFSQSTGVIVPGVDLDGDGDDLLCNNTLVPLNSCSTTEGYCVAEGLTPGSRVRIGSVPYKEIGVGKEDVVDVHGNQFTYAVVEAQASENLYEAPDDVSLPVHLNYDIQIFDVNLTDRDLQTGIYKTATDTTRFADMVFFTHGKSGAGSFTAMGSSNASLCDGSANDGAIGTGDRENCDNDSIFATERFSSRSAAAVGLPDDKLVYTDELINWTYIWDGSPIDSSSIYNRAAGDMAVGLTGADIAQEKLHIARGNLRVEARIDPDPLTGLNLGLNDGGKLQTTLLCNEAGLNCFKPTVISGADPIDAAGVPIDIDGNGPDIHPDRLRCDTEGYLMVGVSNGNANCRSVVLDTSVSCAAFEYARGFSLDPSTNTMTLDCVSFFSP